METMALRTETKNLIDTFDYEQVLLVYNYAQSVIRQKKKSDLRQIMKYRGKLDLDIDLDELRGRNDPR
ncbi:MAG: hypothetical protein J6P07_02045 [Spirochaetaceae bacterium]|nr:hypothetical protein [Spirochaetaceae bacterium]MBO7419995.1 hypothetical protein [Spirochaetaceae bacterium]